MKAEARNPDTRRITQLPALAGTPAFEVWHRCHTAVPTPTYIRLPRAKSDQAPLSGSVIWQSAIRDHLGSRQLCAVSTEPWTYVDKLKAALDPDAQFFHRHQ